MRFSATLEELSHACVVERIKFGKELGANEGNSNVVTETELRRRFTRGVGFVVEDNIRPGDREEDTVLG